MDEELTFVRFERRAGVMVAVFRENFVPIIDGRAKPESCFRLEFLRERVANLKAGGYDASISEKALREWPDPDGCPTNS